jgi:hypothetical protein
MKKTSLALAALAALALNASAASTAVPVIEPAPTDAPRAGVLVYGATPAGVMAAVAAGRAGHNVTLLEASYLVGGLMSGGLFKTDIGRADTIGGLSREFFDRVLAHYKKTGDKALVAACTDGGKYDTGFFFEPKVALQVFREMLAEAGVTLLSKEQLLCVGVDNKRVTSLVTRHYETGKTTRFTADVFVDGTYEGDLMAGAGALYRVGREARSEFNEPLAGVTAGPPEFIGKGDQRVQAYNIRSTLSTAPDRVPVPRPRHYYRDAHASHIATIKKFNLSGIEELFTDYARWAPINGKYDPNKADFPGVNFAYADGSYEERARITREVQDYWLSLWWLLQNDPEIPETFRANAKKWGLPADEYLESGHVSPQLYVRVARRLLGRYFLTQHDLTHDRHKPDAVCKGSYNMDAHPIHLIQTDAGPAEEGHINASTGGDYEIPYRSLLPHGLDNLVVAAAISASHIAYSSVRMEPVFMMLGHAAGQAAALARETQLPADKIPVATLRAKLEAPTASGARGIPLHAEYKPLVALRLKNPDARPALGKPVEIELVPLNVRDDAPLKLLAWNFDGSGALQAPASPEKSMTVAPVFTTPGAHTVTCIATDAAQRKARPATLTLTFGDAPSNDRETHYTAAKLEGRWDRVRGQEIEYLSRVGLIDDKKADGRHSATFPVTLPKTGRYLVAVAYPTAGKRGTTAAPCEVTHAGGVAKITLNQFRKTDLAGKPTPFAFVPVGEWRFEAGKPYTVKISNQNAPAAAAKGATPAVTIDAVRWIWLGE